jgi:MinD superfamily P-loop ATPase
MKFAILSGKGGTGKTLCAVNLAAVCPGSIYMDCDVEEPDGHLFFKPQKTQTEKITAFLPKIDPVLCNGCRQCIDFCRFNALAMIGASITVFSDVCHSCGGCAIICPKKAIADDGIEIGLIENGIAGKNRVITGCMCPGRESGVPIIKRMTKMVENSSDFVFIDCSPGTSCTTVEA